MQADEYCVIAYDSQRRSRQYRPAVHTHPRDALKRPAAEDQTPEPTRQTAVSTDPREAALLIGRHLAARAFEIDAAAKVLAEYVKRMEAAVRPARELYARVATDVAAFQQSLSPASLALMAHVAQRRAQTSPSLDALLGAQRVAIEHLKRTEAEWEPLHKLYAEIAPSLERNILSSTTFAFLEHALGQRMAAGRASEAIANERIKELASLGRIREARVAAESAATEMPDSKVLSHWRAVLAPTRVRHTGRATGRSRRREHAWLRQHAREYSGQWVALAGEQLLAAGPVLSEVREGVRAKGMLPEALFHFVPREPDGEPQHGTK